MSVKLHDRGYLMVWKVSVTRDLEIPGVDV